MNYTAYRWHKKLREEAGDIAAPGVADMAPGAVPVGDADFGSEPAPVPQAEAPPEDVSQDPPVPEMPDDDAPSDVPDFHRWRDAYLKESVKGDVARLLDMIHQVRDADLEPYEHKFVEDNLQILFLRQNANIDKACKDIRGRIKKELDQNNPAVSVVNHVESTLAEMPELNTVFIKLKGLGGMKGDAHRKFVASLLGAVQVGSGGNQEDIIYNEREYSIRISTRYNDQWGRLELGKWCLRADDPERYLTEPEVRRLEEGSPEEKEALRKRVIVESIADQYRQRAFIANVAGSAGTVYALGWDLSGSLRAAYGTGKLVVKTSVAENSEAMLTDEGEIKTFMDVKVKYVRETGRTGEDGKPETEEFDFLERIDGSLYLTASLRTLREASSSFQGIILKETPYPGNPSDLKVLQRCVPSAQEFLMRSC